ncbi:uncharacterized protein [Anabrus simplex]|uniref:uncharacterized protein n=1 Tax=Anabrus simplex TaxID=316456 RepID=UPI0035A3CBB4
MRLGAVYLLSSLLITGAHGDKRQTYNAGDLLGFLSNLAAQATSVGYPQQQTPSPGEYGLYSPQTSQYPSQDNQGPTQFPGQYPLGQGVFPSQYPGQFPSQLPLRPGGPGLFPPGSGLYPGQYPAYSSLLGALGSIARYDTLRCVPRLLCEVVAGGQPGYTGKQGIINRDSLLTLLTVLQFGEDSPLLVFGRAALLGFTAQGDPRTCLSAYPICPQDPEQLVYYLNNHNGGFFRFFNRHPFGNFRSDATSTDQSEEKVKQVDETFIQKQRGRDRDSKTIKFPRNIPNPSVVSENNRLGKTMKFPKGDSENDARITTSNNIQTDEIIADEDGYLNTHYYGAQDESSSPFQTSFSDSSIHSFKDDYKTEATFSFPNHNQESLQYGHVDESPTVEEPVYYNYPPYPESGGVQQYISTQSGFNTRKPKTITKLAFPSKEVNHVSSHHASNQNPLSPVPMVFPDRTGTGDLRLDTDEYGRIIIFSTSSNTRNNKELVKSLGKEHRNPKELKFPLHVESTGNQAHVNKAVTSLNMPREIVVFPNAGTD